MKTGLSAARQTARPAPESRNSGASSAPEFARTPASAIGHRFSQIDFSPRQPIQRVCGADGCDIEECTEGELCGAADATHLPPVEANQRHFAMRAMTKKGPPVAVLQEPHDSAHGAASLHGGQLSTSKYRQPQMQHHAGGGGTGIDEMASTATVRDFVATVTPAEALQATERLSQERIETAREMWATDDAATPIAGHPGALTTHPGDMRHGVTMHHGTKDPARAEAVRSELQHPGASLADRLEDAALRSRVETVQNFMHPYPELAGADVSGATQNVYHPQFGQVIVAGGAAGPSTHGPGFDAAARAVHNERERLKEEAAVGLINRGYSTLVDPAMQVRVHGGGTPPAGAGAPRSLSDPLPGGQTLGQIETDNQLRLAAGQPPRRPISPPRERAGGRFLGPPIAAPPPMLQRTLTHLWGSPGAGSAPPPTTTTSTATSDVAMSTGPAADVSMTEDEES